MDKLNSLTGRYRGVQFEDEMVEFYPICAFGNNGVAASIDTPLHGFLPFAHIDHLAPRLGNCAGSRGKRRAKKWRSSIGRFGHKLVWLPWQRPGFELGDDAAGRGDEDSWLRWNRAWRPRTCSPGAHTQRECYRQHAHHHRSARAICCWSMSKNGATRLRRPANQTLAKPSRRLRCDLFPLIRGRVSARQRMIGNFSDLPEVLRFVNSADAETLAHLGTSCPDHFIRTKIRPLFVRWDAEAGS